MVTVLILGLATWLVYCNLKEDVINIVANAIPCVVNNLSTPRCQFIVLRMHLVLLNISCLNRSEGAKANMKSQVCHPDP